MMKSNEFGFKQDVKIIDLLKSQKFTFSAEIIPPRNGVEQVKVLDQIKVLISAGAEFFSVTKGAGGSLRGGSLPISQAIKDQFGVPCIAHFTCRDMTPQEVENQLMDHHYFGIRNILALRGDPPTDQPDWRPHSESLRYAYQLIRQIRELNEGRFLPRPGARSDQNQVATDFCIGAAVYPEHPVASEKIEFLKMKVDEGAEYGITQMIFDASVYAQFLEDCAKQGLQVPILPGSLILRSQAQAHRMMKRFGIQVSAKIMNKLPAEREANGVGRVVDLFLEYLEDLKRVGAPGVHLFVMSDIEASSGALEKMKLLEVGDG
ncbi:MAG: hypothetical protein COV44_08150 [Deltaproteobacteria bacterium CG11_big_fil_rev_8_21_14_0_20_45_16]|nr:MAG: hypothetical protein COV44_08150 [Deltaproteobacteria bacterium CG11_big_fil_rev_8_21_14_0_20_45_16]